MPTNTHLALVSEEAERLAETPGPSPTTAGLRARGCELPNQLSWLPNEPRSKWFAIQTARIAGELDPILASVGAMLPEQPVSEDLRALRDAVRLIETEIDSVMQSLKNLERIPHVRDASGQVIPRAAAIADAFITQTGNGYSEEEFSTFIEGFQSNVPLQMKELWALVPAIKLGLLEQIIALGTPLLSDPLRNTGASLAVQSLRDVGQTAWKDVIEPLICFEAILREDPAGAYGQMEFDSRDLYRSRLVEIADRSEFSELEVAQKALALAQDAARQTYYDPRVKVRHSHVGHYIVGDGVESLHEQVGYHPTFGARIHSFLRNHPDEFYLPGIEILIFAIVLAIVLPLIGVSHSLGMLVFAALVSLLPASQSAVQLMNYLTTTLLRPQILPKLDFSEGLPEGCLTLVAVPALLLNENQVRTLVDDLEVRYLGNHDPLIHFALLTDLPDSRELTREENALVDLCAELIAGLNEKYADRGEGAFLLLHRHRIYNPHERVWMGWERKRGKLLDLNRLLRGQYDSFPVKIGDVSILPRVRFVITLDADTELPRGSAKRMVGTMAHPLNHAIIDPENNIVVAGYGILQPRVGVSVASASASRLASIYSGETGLDIYSRAVSDIYQDLYGEGSFTGKGIYEVDTVHQVLDRRFPRNALLSHDLIEGAYARAGLASDVEVTEDYPSHYSAYNRRKHHWLRGDWQIAGWLLPRVPDESGAKVKNPITLISQWKILDNLRRSLVEPATFLMLVLGWLVLPATPLYWTLAILGILFAPAFFQLLFQLTRAAITRKASHAFDACEGFFTTVFHVFLTLTFLAHQTMLSVDAVIRSLVRRLFTRRRMLEWETAAEAELGERRTPVDTYLDWVPAVALGLALLIWWIRPDAILAAAPILLLWACNRPIVLWLNRPSRPLLVEVAEGDEIFLRGSALHTWRYFAEFSTAEHNWLIPDNVQEDPPRVAARFSPTNVGLLLNARQVACELGYLTLPEFAELTRHTLNTVAKLQKHRGHLLNWYDTRTLEPLSPRFVSSVDSGNLVASLWTLQQGCSKQIRRPLLSQELAQGVLDHCGILHELHSLPRRDCAELSRKLGGSNWLTQLLSTNPSTVAGRARSSRVKPTHVGDAAWFSAEAERRMEAIRSSVENYLPWLLPEFSAVLPQVESIDPIKAAGLPLEQLPRVIDDFTACLDRLSATEPGANGPSGLIFNLQQRLSAARKNILALIAALRSLAATARQQADAMDFSFLLDPRRKLLSAGYDADACTLHTACYDLLASESRTAVFVAIAKEDIEQESWFLLGRTNTLDHGRPVLLSWTGTMFEYLMPALWTRTYPNTLLERSSATAVASQRAYTATRGMPWGISESAYAQRDEAGNYQYHAFGLPQLALRRRDLNCCIVSPYSSFLALNIDAPAAIANLRRLQRFHAFGSYGFYEAIDFTAGRRFWKVRNEVVRCWMAHHQGMILLSIANLLRDGVVQKWFHSDRRVQATELLLHEKPVEHVESRSRLHAVAA